MTEPSTPSPLHKFFRAFELIFGSKRFGWIQWVFIILVALAFIGMPQKPQGTDWDLNTSGFWDDIPRTYLNNENFVYPPWGIILMWPYFWVGAGGARVLSVLTIGWLVHRRGWPLSSFLAVILSPYFLLAMSISNIDVLVMVLPILLWEFGEGKKGQNVLRGLALSLMLVKPQGALPVVLFLVWKSRKDWRGLAVQLAVAAALLIPISLVGSPPLLAQWLDNILTPSAMNQGFWRYNNVSLTQKWGVWIAAGTLLLVASGFALLFRKRPVAWNSNQTLAALILSSMLMMPYTSVQSLVAGLALIPSWPAFLLQWAIMTLGLLSNSFFESIHGWSLLATTGTLLLFSLTNLARPRPVE